MPHFLVEPSVAEFLAKDSIGFAHGFETVARDGAEASYAEPRAGEGLTINHIVRQTEFETASAYFVLEELLEGFNEAELKVFG